MPRVDIPWEVLDEISVASLSDHYTNLKKDPTVDKKLLKALKRVIEYYGGNVDE